MLGEKPTSKALQLAWQGTLRPADSTGRHERCKVAVVGIGGAGNNTVTQLARTGIKGAYTIAINTDMLQLSKSQADQKILIGEKSTRGLGTNGKPALGKAAAKESKGQVEKLLASIDIVLITASLGGGTGVGAAPIIAEVAKKEGAITIGVVTKPHKNKRSHAKTVSHALARLRQTCDTLIVIDAQKLLETTPKLSPEDAFKIVDQVAANTIKALVEAGTTPNLTNPDFNCFKTILKQGGVAVVGIGESNAPNRAEEAIRNALNSPMLGTNCAKATGALVHIIADSNMTTEEANRIEEIIAGTISDSTPVFRGTQIDPGLHGKMRITLVVTGITLPNTSRRLESLTPQLFNLEPKGEPEKQLPLDLDLYQLENF
jgi:cell division protein FtsZ